MTTQTAPALEADYATLTEAAGLLDRSDRGKVEVTGPDAAEYLQSQVTNDVEALGPGEGCYAALLDPKAHLEADMRILSAGPADLWLDTEPHALEALVRHLRMYKIGRRVEIADRTAERAILSLLGPGSADVATAAARVAVPPGEHAWVEGRVGAEPVRIARTALGADLIAASGAAEAVSAALRQAGARPVGAEAAEVVRVEHGIPRLGADMGPENLPAEAGIVERAVSFTKGCYIGQEPVARMHHRGRPNRRLRGLTLTAPVPAGAAVTSAAKEVGRLTSSVISPRLGPIGLVILRREVEAGDEVAVGEDTVSAKVVELPFATSG